MDVLAAWNLKIVRRLAVIASLAVILQALSFSEISIPLVQRRVIVDHAQGE
jgi:hypothetical protein